jgi:hypothetical protein
VLGKLKLSLIFLKIFLFRLRSDKSQKDSRASQTNLYQSPALVLTSSSAPLIKTIKYNYGTNTFDQNSKTRVIISD